MGLSLNADLIQRLFQRGYWYYPTDTSSGGSFRCSWWGHSCGTLRSQVHSSLIQSYLCSSVWDISFRGAVHLWWVNLKKDMWVVAYHLQGQDSEKSIDWPSPVKYRNVASEINLQLQSIDNLPRNQFLSVFPWKTCGFGRNTSNFEQCTIILFIRFGQNTLFL